MTALTLRDLLDEYDLARAWTEQLTADLDDATLFWRPSDESSAIAWHLGHQAAVNHFLIRNLMSAEPSPDPDLDAAFDSATPEADRGDLPDRARLAAYRAAVGERTRAMVERIDQGAVGAPTQMPMIAAGVLVAAINHEYQHDAWVDEMRQLQGLAPGPVPGSGRVTMIDGYWVIQP